MTIYCREISKHFHDTKVLEDITFSLEGGNVYCLLGRNGAGKSTLINVMTDLIKPDKGELYFNGRTFLDDAISIKMSIGLQSQYDQLIEEFNAKEYLQMIGTIYKMDVVDIANQSKVLLQYFFDAGEDITMKSKFYSSGMKKKLVLCGAFLHKPRLLILDEPFATLDPVASENLCTLINAYRNPDRTIFISSHDLLYVDKVATHIGVLYKTKLVFNGALETFKGYDGNINENLLEYLHINNVNPKILSQIV